MLDTKLIGSPVDMWACLYSHHSQPWNRLEATDNVTESIWPHIVNVGSSVDMWGECKTETYTYILRPVVGDAV